MKKMTKKQYNEAPAYMVAVDYRAGKGEEHGKRPWQTWQTEALEAKDILEAMDRAEEWSNEDVYMLHICEKAGTEENMILYKAILANRKNGWHTHTEKHGEQTDMAFRVDLISEYGGGFDYAEYTTINEEE